MSQLLPNGDLPSSSFLAVPKNPYENDFIDDEKDSKEGSVKLNDSETENMTTSIKKKKNTRLKRDKELRKRSNRDSDIFSKTDIFSDDYTQLNSRKKTMRKHYKKWMLYPEDPFKVKWDLFITL